MTADLCFKFIGLDAALFAPLFDLPDSDLAARGIQRVIADADRGFPCRVSLVDAKAGEELLLLAHEHQPARSPYRASGPIFVRRGATRAVLPPDELAPCVRGRLMSVRAYDQAHQIVVAEVLEGEDLPGLLRNYLAREDVAYLHLHNARRGCFSCEVRRA